MSTIPPFSFSNEVTAATAKQDHLHVTFGDWIITGTTEDIDSLRDRMAVPPQYLRQGNVENIMANWGRLFKRPQQHGTSRSPLAVRREALEIGTEIIPPPLFSGQWRLSNYVQNGSSRQPTLSRLKLHLNPTRYARYQGAVPLPDSAPNSPWPEARLFAGRGAAEVRGEVVLNDNDNWIPTGQRLAAFTNPLRWRRHLRTYFQAVAATFECELARVEALPGQNATWSRPAESLNLHSAETYWEFSSDNPTAVVASIKPLLDSFTARHREAVVHRQPGFTRWLVLTAMRWRCSRGMGISRS